MPNQYQNFSNPTIIPDQPMGWQATQQSMGNLGDALRQQFQQRQALQLAIAQQASQAQMDVWKNLQDPIARALTMGKLGEMGFPVGQMGNMTGNIPSMSQMLQGNPYANMVPQWGQGNSVTPSPNQNTTPSTIPQGGFNMPAANPVGNQSQFSFSPGGQFVQPNIKMGPFGSMPSDVTNLLATNAVEANKAYAGQVGQAQGKQAAATNMLDNITQNLASDLKAHFIEAGGGGPVRGRVTDLSTMFGQSPATFGLKNTVRDSAIAYARDLAGGSQGVQRLFQQIGETIPQAGTTQEQAATALLQMHLTAAQLNAGMQSLGFSPKDIESMTDQGIQKVMSHGQIDRQGETQKFAQMLQSTQPTKVLNMEGKESNPTLNPIVQKLFNVSQQQPDQNGNVQGMLQAYKEKYPGRSDQEIITAMKKQGLI